MKMYEISEKQIEKITDVLYYFQHHNKNLTKAQESMIDQLEEVADRLYDIFSGYVEDECTEVTIDAFNEIVDGNKTGKYYAYDESRNLWIAFDNEDGDGFIETFDTNGKAIDWLSDY